MASFKELSGIMGEKAAVQLSVVFGGARIYVPVAADPDGWLSKAIGGAAANALCRAYGGEQTDIPVGPGTALLLWMGFFLPEELRASYHPEFPRTERAGSGRLF